MAKKKTEKTLDAADQFLQAQGASLRDISQNELELIERAVKGGDKAAGKELKELIAKDVIHVPQGMSRPVLGPAPKPKAEVVPQDFGKSGKKELTAAEKKEMEAAEKKAVEAAAARKKAEQEELNKLLAEKKAAEEAKAAAAAAEPKEPAKPKVERPAEEKAKKNAPGKETKTPTSKSVAAGIPTREVAPARDVSPPAPAKKETGVPVEKPSRQEQQAAMGRMKERTKTANKTEADKELAAASGLSLKGDTSPTASPEDRIKGLRNQNFKKEWSRTPEAVKQRILDNTFGKGRTAGLSVASRNQLGELALAQEAFKQTGLTSLPNMDDVDKVIVNLREQIQDVRDPKNVARVIDARHGQLLAKGSGKIKADLLKFRSEGSLEASRQRQVDKAAREKKAKAEERSMSREGAAPKPTKKKKSLEEAAGLPVGTPTETPAAAAAPAKPGKMSLEEAAGIAPAAAPSTTMPTEKELTAFQKAVNADPAKYGTGFGRGNMVATDEQRVNRKALADSLGLNNKEAAAPAAPAAAPAATTAPAGKTYKELIDADPAKYGTGHGRGKVKATKEQYAARRALNKELLLRDDPDRAAINKLYGEALKLNPTKYGKAKKKLTDAQKTARNELYAKLETDYLTPKGRIATRGAAAAAAAVPEAAGPMAGPWSEAASGGRVMGPTPATGELGPTAPSSLATGKAPKVPAPKVPAPMAPTTPAPAAATGSKPSASEVRDRAKKIFGNKGVGAMGGAMRFLGPLLGAFTAYQLLDMARQGTVGAADERRLQALQALGGVSGGLMSDAQQKQQLRQMQQMVDLAAIQRQQGLDQMRQQYTTDQTLNSLLAGNERALAALAMPSRPSIAEMMARY
jgi:hypothetical protein